MIKKTEKTKNKRLLYLLNNYPKKKKKELKSKLEFARLLYDNYWDLLGFSIKRTIDSKFNYTSIENNLYRNDVDIVYKEFCKDLETQNCNASKSNYIIAYCKYFGCSSDYLLGFIDLPTKEKTDFNKLTGLLDDCIDTLTECKKHEAYDNSWADYNQNITHVLNYLLYKGKNNLINHDKITLLNDIFNYLVLSDFDSYTDNDGIPQGSHITFTCKSGSNLCSLPVSIMHNVIKLNINSTLDTLKKHIKESGFFKIAKPPLEDLLNEIRKNQDKINGYEKELDEILENKNPMERKLYIGTLIRCEAMCQESIHKIENDILVNYKDMLQKKDFSNFSEWEQTIFEKLYAENEYYITNKL